MKKILMMVVFLAIYMAYADGEQNKTKLYTFYTPSHAVFKDWFLSSAPANDCEIIVQCFDQGPGEGSYRDAGWNHVMLLKVDMIIDAIKQNWGKVFIYADIDIQFFRPMQPLVEELMGDHDMLIQRDDPAGELCAGFFMCRANEQTLKLWKKIRKIMIQDDKDDQKVLNAVLKTDKKMKALAWDYLPVEFFSGGTLTGERWIPGKFLPVPGAIVLHHANWTVGVPNKLAQLAYVKELVDKRVLGVTSTND